MAKTATSETVKHRVKLGKAFKKARGKKTLYSVAKQAGITIGQLKDVETGEKAYTVDTFIKLNAVLGIMQEC